MSRAYSPLLHDGLDVNPLPVAPNNGPAGALLGGGMGDSLAANLLFSPLATPLAPPPPRYSPTPRRGDPASLGVVAAARARERTYSTHSHRQSARTPTV